MRKALAPIGLLLIATMLIVPAQARDLALKECTTPNGAEDPQSDPRLDPSECGRTGCPVATTPLSTCEGDECEDSFDGCGRSVSGRTSTGDRDLYNQPNPNGGCAGAVTDWRITLVLGPQAGFDRVALTIEDHTRVLAGGDVREVTLLVTLMHGCPPPTEVTGLVVAAGTLEYELAWYRLEP